MFRELDNTILVAGQVTPQDIAEAARLGVTMVINNRPDGEASEQPEGESIEAAARAAGMGYRAIPITPGRFSADEVDAMAAALGEAGGRILAFCRTGTRSTLLWALARTKMGDDPGQLAEAAAAAGYDLAPIAPLLAQVAAARTAGH